MLGVRIPKINMEYCRTLIQTMRRGKINICLILWNSSKTQWTFKIKSNTLEKCITMAGFRGSKKFWIRDTTEQPHVLILLSEKKEEHNMNWITFSEVMKLSAMQLWFWVKVSSENMGIDWAKKKRGYNWHK